jgi:hypothetical protein
MIENHNHLGTLLAFAGFERPAYRDILIEYAPRGCSLAFPYFYKQVSKNEFDPENLKADLEYFDYVFVDSGAHFVQQAIARKNSKFSPDLYLASYFEFAKMLTSYVDVFEAPQHIFDSGDLKRYVSILEKMRESGIPVGVFVSPQTLPSDLRWLMQKVMTILL